MGEPCPAFSRGARTTAHRLRGTPGHARGSCLDRVPDVPGPAGKEGTTMALTRRIAKELRETGTYRAFTDDTIPYAEANKLFVK